MSFVLKENCGVPFMTSDILKVPHAFTTRLGGVSGGIWESLNLGENRGDTRENVEENYRRISCALGVPDKMVFTRQVHGCRVEAVDESDLRSPFGPTPPERDGLITARPNVPLIIFTADCIPILFHDGRRGAIGACHAGWRGTVADIAGETVRQMASTFGCRLGDIRAAIGPGIGPCCFETGAEVPEAVMEVLGDIGEEFISPKENGKFMVDLKGVNRSLLIRAGLLEENIDVSEECTKCLHEKYWSHRYTQGARGSQASIIVLKGT